MDFLGHTQKKKVLQLCICLLEQSERHPFHQIGNVYYVCAVVVIKDILSTRMDFKLKKNSVFTTGGDYSKQEVGCGWNGQCVTILKNRN